MKIENNLQPVFIVDDRSFLKSTLFNSFKACQFFLILDSPENIVTTTRTLIEMEATVVDTLSAMYIIEGKHRKENSLNKNWFPILR